MKRTLALSIVVSGALAVAGCGGSEDPATPAAAASTPAASTPAAVPATVAVSANTASEDELTAALETAGVSNAAKWADEIVEYRPYPADDTGFAKLRKELAKYNPAPDQLELIVGALTP